MTKVSKIPLRSDVWERIFDLFIGTLTDIKDKKKLEGFISDFFSPTERIVFAKRLALAVLLAKNHNYQSINKILRISPPTIAKMSLKVKYEGKGLSAVIDDVLKKQASQVIWKEIESLFDLPTKANLKSLERFKRNSLKGHRIREIKTEF